MARKRVIDSDGLYFKADLVRALGDRGLHLYIRLWALAEDWGGYEYDPESIALQMGALKFSSKEVEGYIRKLIERKKIIPYQANGKTYHWLKNFLEHQPLTNPIPPKLPLPEWIQCDLKNYKSGKRYAKYAVITGSLPVAYQYTTGSDMKRKQKGNGKETETEKKLVREKHAKAFVIFFLVSFKTKFRKDSYPKAVWKERFAKDYKLAGELLATHNLKALKGMVIEFFEREDPGLSENDFTVEVFCSWIADQGPG